MAKNIITTSTTTNTLIDKSVFQKFENWAEKNDSKLFYTFVGLTALFSALLFNARISEAHDDAMYIESGWKYINDFPNYFHTANAPLYSIFLAVVLKVFGLNLLLLKLINVAFTILSVVLFYKAFSKRIPYAVLLPIMIFLSCNFMIHYFGSMTFSEAFYIFLEGAFFYCFVKLHDALLLESNPQKHIKHWLLLGFVALLISAARNIGILVFPCLVFYFFSLKQYKNGLYAIGTLAVNKLMYEVFIYLVWGNQHQFATQQNAHMRKEYYDPSKGTEDFSGFISRLIENCDLYISKRLFQMLGFRDENSLETHSLLTVIVIVFTIFGLYFFIKNKNNPLYLFGLFTLGQVFASFIILSPKWDQPRLYLTFIPISLVLGFYFLYVVLKKTSFSQSIYIVILAIVSISIVTSSLKRSAKNFPILTKNLKGDIYYGYTPDWQNFLKCSSWCSDTLTATDLVASRKAPMSFIYGKGKAFFPIYSVLYMDTLTNQSNPDSALTFFKKNKITHIMLASLRTDPRQNTGSVINTIHNIAQPIMTKYPEKLTLIHTEGAFEQTYVFKINY